MGRECLASFRNDALLCNYKGFRRTEAHLTSRVAVHHTRPHVNAFSGFCDSSLKFRHLVTRFLNVAS